MNATHKPAYERPTILRHRVGAMNKMGAAPALRHRSDLGGVPVDELLETYGSPLFVYEEDTLRQAYRALRDHLQRRWPRVQLAWSYKTAYLDAICHVFHDEGAWAEVVSGMEFRKARRMGVPVRDIVYNGPDKDDETLEEAVLGGARIHVDHYDELARLEALAETHRVRPGVALRINLDTGGQQRWDRFGFHLDSGQAWDAVKRLVAGDRLRLVGLHCHVGTYVLDPAAYREAASKIAAFANRIRRELGLRLEYLDLGGGFASTSQLRGQYLPADQVTPSFDQYAEALTDGLSALDGPEEERPLLILETGRALVDEAGTLITTLKANKRLADGRRALVIDAGVNVLFTSYWYKHRLTPAAPVSGQPEPTVVYGNLCMNIDVVCDNILLPPMDVGTPLLVAPVGAYNVTQSMTFIHLQPAVAMVGRGGRHAVIREAQTLDDLVRGERMPPWLAEGA